MSPNHADVDRWRIGQKGFGRAFGTGLPCFLSAMAENSYRVLSSSCHVWRSCSGLLMVFSVHVQLICKIGLEKGEKLLTPPPPKSPHPSSLKTKTERERETDRQTDRDRETEIDLLSAVQYRISAVIVKTISPCLSWSLSL